MNSLLITFALLSNQTPTIDVNDWFDMNAWRDDVRAQIVQEAAEVSEYLRSTVLDNFAKKQRLELEPESASDEAATQTALVRTR